MTDNELDKLNREDERMLQSFFAEQRIDIADDGFSDKVMGRIPTYDPLRLERWWSVACLFVGIVFLIAGHVWTHITAGIFDMRVQGMLTLSHGVEQLSKMLSQTHDLWMMIVAVVTLLLVWGYNKIEDARI